MGSITKVSNKNWKVRWEEPGSGRENRKRKQRSGFNTKGEASAFLRNIESQIRSGTYGVDDKRLTVNKAFHIWFDKHVSLRLKPKTEEGYKYIFSHFIAPRFGEHIVDEIKPIEIMQFYEELQVSTSEDNTFRVHKVFRSCLNKMYQWEYTDKKVLDRVESPPKPKPEIEYWYPDQTETALLSFAPGLPIEFHVYTALKTGLRLGEICALKEDDFDFEHNLMTVSKSAFYSKGELIITTPKTRSSVRKIPLTNEMVNYYKKYINKLRQNRVLFGPAYNQQYIGLLSLMPNGDYISPYYVTVNFTKSLKDFKDLSTITFHALRHTFASNHVYRNTPLNVLQRLLGHASISTTSDVYGHINPEMLRKAQNNI